MDIATNSTSFSFRTALCCIGYPSYDDPGIDPHVSEAGSPHVRYAILTIDEQQMSAEMLAVAYDWAAAAARAEKNGRPEWA